MATAYRSERARGAVAKSPRPLVSLMLANNETGVIEPVAEAAAIVHAGGGLLHVDAVQAAGRVSCDIAALGADLPTLSASRWRAKGGGALIRGREDIHFPDPLIRGGGQERGFAPAPRMWPESPLSAQPRPLPGATARPKPPVCGTPGRAGGRSQGDHASGRHFRCRRPTGCRTPRYLPPRG